MGKHGTGYARVGRDHYPTPYWVIAALAEWLELRGLTVWEPACGDGGMAAALRQQSCARVHNLRPRKPRVIGEVPRPRLGTIEIGRQQ